MLDMRYGMNRRVQSTIKKVRALAETVLCAHTTSPATAYFWLNATGKEFTNGLHIVILHALLPLETLSNTY